MKEAEQLIRPVLVVGGAGVFGSRLAEGLIRDSVPGVVIAGRSRVRLSAVATRIGSGFEVLDLDAPDLEDRIAALTPAVVIDAAGPFQEYGTAPYRLARAALAAGAHYLDLSDDAAFTAGIAALDDAARASGLAVISGVSSVPALTSAAVRALSESLARIDLIDSMILPGNRAPRGRSVMAAILAQAGKALPGNGPIRPYGWIGTERITVSPEDEPAFTRLASPIGAPDLLLMPGHFGTPDVRFRAGLELPLMHRGLALIALAVRFGLLKSARSLLPLVQPLARLLEPFGSDVGAMRVLVRGQTAAGQWVDRVWTLTANAGDGPHVPAIPGRVLVRKLLAGDVASGARPCLDELTLAECEAAAPERALSFTRSENPFTPLFETILAAAFTRLPQPIRDLHDVRGSRRWSGRASVTRNPSRPARLVARLFAFPPETDDTPVTVTMQRQTSREVWTRDFGGHVFLSRLSSDPAVPGRMWERFGPFTFAIDLNADGESLAYPVTAGRFLGLTIPKALLPRSDTRETVDVQGRACFDVGLSLPMVGEIVRYRGWLRADQPISGDQELPAFW